MNDITDLFYEQTFKSLWMHNLNSLSEALLQNLEKIELLYCFEVQTIVT
jgi:hypothetical protein